MANILQFPGAAKADLSNDTAVSDVKWLLADDSAMTFGQDNSVPLFRSRSSTAAFSKGDWTNQELADLYRVEAILVQAGVKLETDRGVTDEDDPWFVFCRPDGDIFVHLARLDGRYLLDSPGLGAPVYGDDFGTLVDLFVRKQMENAPSGNVVRFRPGSSQNGVVRLHPSMMLAALIWTLYLAADSVTNSAHAAEPDGASGDGDYAGDSFWFAGSESYYSAGDGNSDGHVGSVLGTRDSAAVKVVAADNRISQMGLSHSGSSVAAGLAAIAVSWGLYDPQLLAAFDMAVAGSDGGSSEGSETQGVQAGQANATTVSSVLDAILQTDRTHAEKHTPLTPSANENPIVAAHYLAEETNKSNGSHDGETSSQSVRQNSTIHDAQSGTIVRIYSGEGKADKLSDAAGVDTPATTTDKNEKLLASTADLQSLLRFASDLLGSSQKYTLGDFSFSATFDVSELSDAVSEILATSTVQAPLVDTGGTVNTAAPSAETKPTATPVSDGKLPVPTYIPSYFAAYDQAAKDFVYNFLRKTASVEMIKVANSIIFVDTTAIDESSDIAAVRSWALDTSTTVSTIGHADYFAKYDLV